MPSLTDTLLIDNARKQIDQEIAHLEHALFALKARRNNLAPILRLPPELLALIFVFNAYSYEDADPIEADDLSWARVAHVCRYWRMVAIDCPRLWYRVTLRGQRWVATVLERSKAVPLVVHADFSVLKDDACTDSLDLIVKNLARVRELSIFSVKNRQLLASAWMKLSIPAPMLESFVFMDPHQHNYLTIPTSNVPSNLFHGECPSLRSLELHQCIWSWQSKLFCSSVTNLVLDARRVRMRSSLGDILEALGRMPLLQYADLDQVAPDVPWSFPPLPFLDRTVHLAHLRTLRIDALAFNVALILNHLSFPANTALVLCCQPFRQFDEFASVGHALCSKFSNTIGTSSRPAIRSFSFFSHTAESLHVRLFTETIPLRALRNDPAEANIELRLSWDGPSPNNSILNLLNTCRALPLRSVQTMYVPEYMPLTARAWVELFSHVEALEALWVACRSALHLPDALMRPFTRAHIPPQHFHTARPHAEDSSYRLFPALRRLELENVNFGTEAAYNLCFFFHLQEMIIERQRQRRDPPLIIAIHRCRNFIQEQIQDLELFGASVQWSGEEILDFDLDEIDSDDSEEDYEEFYDEPLDESLS